jgi:hypothetical protein
MNWPYEWTEVHQKKTVYAASTLANLQQEEERRSVTHRQASRLTILCCIGRSARYQTAASHSKGGKWLRNATANTVLARNDCTLRRRQYTVFNCFAVGSNTVKTSCHTGAEDFLRINQHVPYRIAFVRIVILNASKRKKFLFNRYFLIHQAGADLCRRIVVVRRRFGSTR